MVKSFRYPSDLMDRLLVDYFIYYIDSFRKIKTPFLRKVFSKNLFVEYLEENSHIKIKSNDAVYIESNFYGKKRIFTAKNFFYPKLFLPKIFFYAKNFFMTKLFYVKFFGVKTILRKNVGVKKYWPKKFGVKNFGVKNVLSFLGGSVLCATNTIVWYLCGQAKLGAFLIKIMPETQNLQKTIIIFSCFFVIKKSRN